MGYLDHGEWHEGAMPLEGGAFKRQDSLFRDKVSAEPGARFPAEPKRYHLFVSLACPWASRTLMARKLKKLDDIIGVSTVSPDMLEHGWTFGGGTEVLTGAHYLYEIYQQAVPDYSGRVTVPVLWDIEARTIVNNESAEIIRMLNHAFDAWGDAGVDLYPDAHAAEIDELNGWIYDTLNNGVYRAGFARSQQAYEEAAHGVFETLDALEERLSTRRYLVGRRFTEADLRLFTTLVRFDLVYCGHFKCNLRQLRDYPNLSGWLRDVYQIDGMAETVDLAQIKRHYYVSQRWVNPSGVVPIGPATIDLVSPHGRERL
jgi:putative glutathione S-transferase